jgi:hypothetical protein
MARRVHRAQQRQAQPEILEYDLGQLGRALAAHPRQPRRAHPRVSGSRQRAGRCQPWHELRQRTDRIAGLRAEPALQRPKQCAGAAIAPLRVGLRGAVDDRPQRQRDLPAAAVARQAQSEASGRALCEDQPVGDAPGIGLAFRQPSHQQPVGQHAECGQVALGRGTVQRQAVAVGARVLRGQRRGQAAELRLAGVIEQQHPALDVVVGDAPIVRTSQRPGRLQHQPAHQRRRQPTRRRAVRERRAPAQLVQHEGPAVLLADLDDRGDLRMSEAGGTGGLLVPAPQHQGVAGLRPRQHDDALCAVGLERQPGHRAGALSQQSQQLQATEHAHRGALVALGLGGRHDRLHCTAAGRPAKAGTAAGTAVGSAPWPRACRAGTRGRGRALVWRAGQAAPSASGRSSTRTPAPVTKAARTTAPGCAAASAAA